MASSGSFNEESSAAGLRLVRWRVKSLPDDMAIKAEFAAKPLVSPVDLDGTLKAFPAMRAER